MLEKRKKLQFYIRDLLRLLLENHFNKKIRLLFKKQSYFFIIQQLHFLLDFEVYQHLFIILLQCVMQITTLELNIQME